MTPLEIYANNVREKAREKSDYLFHNEGNGHALVICQNLFESADSHIRIAANQLYNDEVVNKQEYISAMKSFLDKPNTKLDIIITNAPERENVRKDGTFYGMLHDHQAYKDGRVIIKVGDGKSFRNGDGKMVNFCTGDERMFRFEDDIEKRTAIANFNDPEMTKDLINGFDNVFGKLRTLNLAGYFV